MHSSTFVLSFVTAIFVAASASAQPLTLQIENGLVNLEANGATVRQILDEWARVGGTRVVNGDRVTGQPLTLKLEGVPERQALEIILRSVAGYMAAPRSASAAPGASMYDRIFVLPTSVAPPPSVNTSAGTAGIVNPNGGDRQFPPRFVRPGEAPQYEAEEPADADPSAPFAFPQPGQFPGAFGQPMMPQDMQQQVPQQPTPGNPFAPTPPQQQQAPFGQPGNAPFLPVQPGTTPFGTPAQPGTTPFGTPVPPGQNPFGTPVQPPQPGQQPPPVFTFTPQMPITQPPTGVGTTGSPVPGVVQQPTTPGRRPPGN